MRLSPCFLPFIVAALFAGPSFAQSAVADPDPPPAASADPTESALPPLPYPRPEAEAAREEAAEPTPETTTTNDNSDDEAAEATAVPANAEGVVEPPAEEGIVPLPRPRPDAARESGGEAGDEDADPDAAASDRAQDAEAKAEADVAAPPRVYQTACPALLLGRVEATMLEPIADGPCGRQSPLSLTGVLANGRMVPFSGAAITDCGMASALPAWIEAIDSWLIARENTRLSEIIVGTSYMCRNVNNATSGNLSFHAFADALDIVGFRLEDGRTVTVEGDWADADAFEGRFLRYAHGAACSNFTTVLGPEANALHHDHFHVDLGCHGRTCTARICE